MKRLSSAYNGGDVEVQTKINLNVQRKWEWQQRDYEQDSHILFPPAVVIMWGGEEGRDLISD